MTASFQTLSFPFLALASPPAEMRLCAACGVRRADFCIYLRADLIFRACRMSRGFLTRNLRAACFVLIQNGVNDSRDYCPNCMRKQQQQQQQQQGERKLSGIREIISVSSLGPVTCDTSVKLLGFFIPLCKHT